MYPPCLKLMSECFATRTSGGGFPASARHDIFSREGKTELMKSLRVVELSKLSTAAMDPSAKPFEGAGETLQQVTEGNSTYTPPTKSHLPSFPHGSTFSPTHFDTANGRRSAPPLPAGHRHRNTHRNALTDKQHLILSSILWVSCILTPRI